VLTPRLLGAGLLGALGMMLLGFVGAAIASSVTNVTVSNTVPSNAAGAKTIYTVGFNTSANGPLVSGNQITLVFPAGTGLIGLVGSSVKDVTTNTTVGTCIGGSGTTATCTVNSGSVAALDQVSVTIDGVVNPATANPREPLQVSTTADTTAVTGTYSVVAANPVTTPTVTNAVPTPAAGGKTIYTFAFNTSATGAMSPAAGSQITLAFPAGTGLTALVGSSVKDVTTGATVGTCNASSSSTSLCAVNAGTVSAGDALSVVVDGVVNPAAGSPTASVSTTSDPLPSASPYNVLTAHSVSSPALALTNGAPGASSVTYTTTFTTSPTGGMSSVAGSQISLAFLAGTVLTHLTGSAVRDTTSGATVGSCNASSSATSLCFVNGGSVNPGDAMSVVINGVTNPAGGNYSETVTTSSDPLGASPSGFTIGSPAAAPTSATGPPTAKSTTSAAFTAIVNPQGLPTTMHFDYGAEGAAGATAAAVSYSSSTPEQAVGSDFADHTVSATVTGLLPNSTYHVRAVATNSAGRTVGADQVLKTPADPPPPPPVLGRAVDVTPVSGEVFVKLPAGAAAAARGAQTAQKGVGFVALTEARQIPVGAEIDTRLGTVRLTSATTAKHKLQSGTFQAGVFRELQSRSRSQKGLVQIQLLDGVVAGTPSYKQCAAASKASAASPRAAGSARAKAKLSSKIVGLLKTNAKGQFQTRGQYSAATVRGTAFDVVDRCDGTLTRVRRGVVVVRDFRLRRNVTLRAGKSYLARA
jgi:hypothetical protein